jgi:hypothetical protein
MVRVPAGAVLLGAVLLGSAAAQVGDVAKQDDTPRRLQLDGLSPSLLSKLVKRSLVRDYKGNKDKEKVVAALAALGGLDGVADNLNYQFKDGKPRFVFLAGDRPRPANAAEVEAALRDVIGHTFTRLAKQPEQLGEERYSIDKADADKVKAELPTALRVVWRPGADRPAATKPVLPAPTAKKDAPAGPAAGGKWQLVVSGYAADCCGRAVPVYRWSWEKGGGGGEPAAAGRVSVEGMRPTDAPRLFWRGYQLYWQGDRRAAWREFEAAARLADDDARYWYYKALTERAMGRDDDAEKSRRRGAALQASARPSAEAVGKALERVQGPERMWLREGLDTLGARP